MITIRCRREDDDAGIVAILNAGFPYYQLTVPRYRHWLEYTSKIPGASAERYVAEVDGTVVGVLSLDRHSWFGRPGSYFAVIAVDRVRRGQGVGSRLNDMLENRARDLGAARIYAEIMEGDESARQFAEARGYVPTGRVDRMSRLPVARASLEGYEGLEDRLAAENIHVRSVAEIGIDDELLRRVQAMEHESERDIPSAEETGEPPPYELWRDDKLFAPGRSPEMFWVALHRDRPIGVARLAEHSEKVVFNGYTGVDRAYRGRGVARLLKLKTIRWAQERGYEWMHTGNDVENTRMLAINVRLGYEPLPGVILVVKEVGTVQE